MARRVRHVACDRRFGVFITLLRQLGVHDPVVQQFCASAANARGYGKRPERESILNGIRTYLYGAENRAYAQFAANNGLPKPQMFNARVNRLVGDPDAQAAQIAANRAQRQAEIAHQIQDFVGVGNGAALAGQAAALAPAEEEADEFM